jgi:DNA-binding CsgD family transcriptional regulator/PAS domain-containing protein
VNWINGKTLNWHYRGEAKSRFCSAMLHSIAITRAVTAGEVEVGARRRLGPHFRRAVTVSNLFDLKAVEAQTFGAALDALAFAVILVDEQLGIVHANAAADTMLSESDPIHSVSGTLTLLAGPANDALRGAVERAAREELALGKRGIGIPARRRNGDPCIVRVQPLRRGEMYGGLGQRAAAAIFVAPATAPHPPMEALSPLYNLTPAEARVFELICFGRKQREIAETLGIAKSTVKTHLLHVFEKTGCRRQVDLVKLAAGLSLSI